MSPTDWLIIAFVAGVLEIISSGFWMLWFAIAAAIVAACLGMEFIVSLNAQLLLFAALSLLFLVFTRPLVMRLFPSKMENQKQHGRISRGRRHHYYCDYAFRIRTGKNKRRNLDRLFLGNHTRWYSN